MVEHFGKSLMPLVLWHPAITSLPWPPLVVGQWSHRVIIDSMTHGTQDRSQGNPAVGNVSLAGVYIRHANIVEFWQEISLDIQDNTLARSRKGSSLFEGICWMVTALGCPVLHSLRRCSALLWARATPPMICWKSLAQRQPGLAAMWWSKRILVHQLLI